MFFLVECLFTIPRDQNAKFLQPSKGRVVLGLENQASNEPCHVSTSPVELLKGSDASGNEDLVPQKKRNFELMIFNFPSRREWTRSMEEICLIAFALAPIPCQQYSPWCRGDMAQPPSHPEHKKKTWKICLLPQGCSFESTSSRQ